MAENLLIIHGGGPTAVINSSLYGAVREAKRRLKGGSVYAAIGGTGGHLRHLGSVQHRLYPLQPADQGDQVLSLRRSHGVLRHGLRREPGRWTEPEERLSLLLQSPASAIGTSRDCLEAEDYAAMAQVIRELGITAVVMNGGNGTMDACGKLYAACSDQGVRVMGIPKTIDNDIAITDHAPGYGSAARYMAASTAEVCADVRSLPGCKFCL